MKISKKTREQAWLICAIGASCPEWTPATDIGTLLGMGYGDVIDLACDAYWAPSAKAYDLHSVERYAEAAALLAEGWTP